jgi:hypothetical protein
MSQLEITRVISQSPEKIWSILKDFGGIYRVHPMVERSPIINGKASGLGAERRCEFYDGSTVEEVVSGYREGTWMEVKITKGSLPLNDIIAAFNLTKTRDGHTQLNVVVDYTPKYGPLGKAMNALMIRRRFKRLFGEVITGIELHAATGVVVGRDGIEAAQRTATATA